MCRSRVAMGLALIIWLSSTAARGDDWGYVTDEELALELERRQEDVERTQARLAELSVRALDVGRRLDETRRIVRDIEGKVEARAGVLYRLSRHGGSLRFLLGAGSATGLLRRFNTLKRLLVDGLEDRRAAGLRLAEEESSQASIETERREAYGLLERLESARDELLLEQQRRLATGPNLALAP